MANQTLGLGSVANDDTGDTLRVASDKINDNFLEIYTLIGDASSLSTGISATASVITLSTPTIVTPNITGTAVMADLDISGDVDIDGTLEADAITINGTTLSETISDTVGAMVTSNTETGITVAYDDADNTLDFTIGTLNQSTTGSAATLTTARTIGGTSFNGSANIAVALSATTTALATARTIGGTSFDGTANIAVGLSATATALATARTIGGTSFDGTGNIAVALASVGTAITVADESSDTTCFPLFATGATGDLGAKSGSNLTFNSSTGLLTATLLAGALTGNVTGNASGTAATVTGAAQTAITSVGTLTALQVDNININLNTISSTAGTDLLITPLSGQQIVLDGAIVIDAGVVTGATSITSTAFVGALTGNASGTAATVTGAAQTAITSVGTLTALQVDNININLNTISSTAGTDLLITPLSGQQIVLDGAIVIDAGVVTGATSITSTAFVGALTGNASGTAATVTGAAQTAITSVGTLTALQVDNLNINGNTISSTAGTDLLITPLSGQQIVLDGAIVIDAGVVTGGTSITSTAFVGNLTGTVATATQNSITTATGLVSVGALNSGSITSGFTSIDVGAGAISTTGAIIGGSVAGRKTLVTTFNTNSAVSASLTAAQSGATILIDGTENNVINLPNAATTNPGIFYDLIVRVAVASDKTTIVNIHGSGGNFVGALSLAGGTAANAVFDNGGDALTFVNSTVIGSRARITCLIDDGTDGVWQVECLASPIATIA